MDSAEISVAKESMICYNGREGGDTMSDITKRALEASLKHLLQEKPLEKITINDKFGVTVILITHHMREAVEADRVVVMNDGKVIADDTPKKVFSQVELLRSVGLTVPETTDLMYDLNEKGWSLPLDALSVEECAQAIYREAAGA